MGGLAVLLRGRTAAPASVSLDAPPSAQGHLRALGRLAVRLLPEYLVVLLAVGALRGLLPLDGAGLGVGPAAVAPALTLPSLLRVREVFPRDVLLTAAGAVALLSALAGVVAL